MSRNHLDAFHACQSVCGAIREAVPTSQNRDIAYQNEIALLQVRNKTVITQFLGKVASLKHSHTYHLSKKQQIVLLEAMFDNESNFWLALLRIGITNKKNPKAFFILLRWLTKLKKAGIRSELFHNDGKLKSLETQSEQYAKRALIIKVGNCCELTELARTYFKLFVVQALIGYHHAVIGFDDHELLMIYWPDKLNQAAIFDKEHASFSDLVKLIPNGTAFFLDAWLPDCVSTENADQLIQTAKAKGLASYFEGTVEVSKMSQLACLPSEKDCYLSQRHSRQDKKEKYASHFFPLHQRVISMQDNNKVASRIQPPTNSTP